MMVKRTWLVVAVLVLLVGAAHRTAWAMGVHPDDAPPTPTPCVIGPDYQCVEATPQNNDSDSGGQADEDDGNLLTDIGEAVSGAVNAVVSFDPSQSLHDLIMDLLIGIFHDMDGDLADFLADLEGALWKALLNTHDGGLYTTAAKPFSAVALILFVPFSILRVVWYNKNHLAEQRDSLLAVALDILGAAIMILAVGPLVDWTSQKVAQLSMLATTKVMVHGAVPQHLGMEEMLAAATDSVSLLILTGFVVLGAIFAVAGMLTAILAVHGIYYILVALGPIIFVLGLFPLLRWLNRLWWYAFGAVLLVPFLGAAAMGALGYIFSLNFGVDVIGVKMIIRIVWLWSAAGLMWSLLGMMTKFTIGVTTQMASKLVTGVAATAGGLLAAGGVAASAGGLGGLGSLGGLGGLLGGGGGSAGAEAGMGMASGAGGAAGSSAAEAATGGAMAGSSGDLLSGAANHTLRAGFFDALSNIPGLGGLRAAGGYHRTLASAMRLKASSAAAAGKAAAEPLKPHVIASQAFTMLTGNSSPGAYQATIEAVKKALGSGIEDPELGPVNPVAWSRSGDPNLASLAGALAAVYSETGPTFFENSSWTDIRAAAFGRLDALNGIDNE